MRIVIDRHRCAGHARCAAIAGDVYRLDDNGYIATEGFEVSPSQEEIARRGACACPERIITVVEDAEPDACSGPAKDLL